MSTVSITVTAHNRTAAAFAQIRAQVAALQAAVTNHFNGINVATRMIGNNLRNHMAAPLRAIAASPFGRTMASWGTSLSQLGNTLSSVGGRLFALQRQTSSVAGAYRSLDGLWRHADGTLITHRHTVTSHTTALGYMVAALRGASSGVGAFGRALGRGLAGLGTGSGNSQGMLGSMALALANTSGRFKMLAAGVALAAGAFGPLLVILAEAAGAIQLLAPAAVAAGTALLTLHMAFDGIGDAIKTGLSDKATDVKKFNADLKKLAPSAAEFVREIIKIAPQWKKIQQSVQGNFFAGSAGDLAKVNAALQPLAAKWLPRIASAFADARKGLADFFASAGTQNVLEGVLRNVERFMRSILGVAKPLVQAFLDIASVAAPSLADIGEGLKSAAERFAAWIRELRDNGALREWLDKAKEVFSQLWEIMKNVGSALAGIFTSSQVAGKSFLETLVDITRKTAEWINSPGGQKWIAMFATIADAALLAVSMIVSGFKLLAPAFGVAANLIIGMMGLTLEAAARAFGWIPGIGPKLQKARDEFRQFCEDTARMLNAIPDAHVNIFIERKFLGPALGGANGYRGLATGGISTAAGGGARNGLTLVGERGAELVQLPQGSRVYPHANTQQMLGNGAGGTVKVELVATGNGRGTDWLEGAIRDALYAGRLRLQVVNGVLTNG